MNIFKILSSYDGSIKEPNISSFLAYLLDLNEDHGLSDLLLKSLVADFKEKDSHFFEKLRLSDLTQYDVRINPEYSVFLNNKRRDIDIVIGFYDECKTEPLYTLCIENKITDGSIQKNDNQLKEELEGLQKEYNENEWKTEIYFCFLTLEESKKSSEEFDNFNYEKKIHLHWKGERSIREKILKILEEERLGEIDPISEDSKFLIRSFLAFIRTDFKSALEEKNANYERKNYGSRTIAQYFFEYAQTLDFSKDYDRSVIRQDIARYIKEQCGVEIGKNNLYCYTVEMTVNDRSRIHYNVTKENCEKKNLFYYPDASNRNIIRRYSKDLTDVEVFTK